MKTKENAGCGTYRGRRSRMPIMRRKFRGQRRAALTIRIVRGEPDEMFLMMMTVGMMIMETVMMIKRKTRQNTSTQDVCKSTADFSRCAFHDKIK